MAAGTWLASALLVAVCAWRLAPAAGDTFPVDFSTVPETPVTTLESPPPGCVCVDSNSGSCSKFDCPCVCDLTPTLCDANCCCDVDCQPDSVARYRTAGACVDEGPAPPNIRKCIDLDTFDNFVEVNPKFRMELDRSDRLDNLLCVVVDNNPTAGVFFADPGIQVGTFDKPPFSFETAAGAVSLPPATAFAYTPGSLLETAGRTPVPVPGPDGGGLCAANSFARYLESVSERPCTQLVADLEAECASLGAGAFGPVFAQSPGSSAMVPTRLLSVTTAGGSVVTVNTTFADYVGVYDPDSQTCMNVVSSAVMNVRTSSTDVLRDASADLVLMNVTAAPGTPAAFTRTVSVNFLGQYAFESGIVRTRSGNPGYISGAPVRAGVLVTQGTQQAIAEFVDGLTVKGPGPLGECSAADTSSVPVNADESMAVSCTVALNLTEFRAACQQWTTLPFVGVNVTHVGLFGNADPTAIGQWLEVQTLSDSEPHNGVLLTDRTCDNLVTEMNLRFLTSDVGELGNPQRKIVGAQVEYSRDTWQFTQLSEATPQTFSVRTIVSFVHLQDGALEEFVPPLPKVLQIDDDLFFPFDLGSGPSSGALPPAGSPAAVAWLCAAVSALWLATRLS